VCLCYRPRQPTQLADDAIERAHAASAPVRHQARTPRALQSEPGYGFGLYPSQCTPEPGPPLLSFVAASTAVRTESVSDAICPAL